MVYAGYLLHRIQLHYICPRTSSGPKPVEDIMELETVSCTCVYERLYHHTEGIQESYVPGVHVPFGYDYQDSPLQLLWYISHLPHVMDDVYQANPALRLGRVFAFSPWYASFPLFEVLRSEVGVSACLKWAQAMNCCLHLCL